MTIPYNFLKIRIFVLLSAFLLLNNNSIIGQDLHFTNYRNVQNFFNPALNGAFLGTYKVQAVARSQFQNTYKTGALGIEYNLFSPLNKKHWIGVALNMNYDQSGDLSLNPAGGGFGLGYHIPLDKKANSVFSIGAEYLFEGIGANINKLRDANAIGGGSDLRDADALKNLAANYSVINAGVAIKTMMGKNASFQLGAAMMHINAPKLRFGIENSSAQSIIGRRINVHSNIRSQMGKQMVIEPAVYLSFNSDSDTQSNLNFQFITEYTIKKKGKWALVTGLGYRAGDAANVILGMKSDKTQVTFSFDLTVSDAAEYLYSQGAFELGGYHIFHPDKTLEVDPIIYCPRL